MRSADECDHYARQIAIEAEIELRKCELKANAARKTASKGMLDNVLRSPDLTAQLLADKRLRKRILADPEFMEQLLRDPTLRKQLLTDPKVHNRILEKPQFARTLNNSRPVQGVEPESLRYPMQRRHNSGNSSFVRDRPSFQPQQTLPKRIPNFPPPPRVHPRPQPSLSSHKSSLAPTWASTSAPPRLWPRHRRSEAPSEMTRDEFEERNQYRVSQTPVRGSSSPPRSRPWNWWDEASSEVTKERPPPWRAYAPSKTARDDFEEREKYEEAGWYGEPEVRCDRYRGRHGPRCDGRYDSRSTGRTEASARRKGNSGLKVSAFQQAAFHS